MACWAESTTFDRTTTPLAKPLLGDHSWPLKAKGNRGAFVMLEVIVAKFTKGRGKALVRAGAVE